MNICFRIFLKTGRKPCDHLRDIQKHPVLLILICFSGREAEIGDIRLVPL